MSALDDWNALAELAWEAARDQDLMDEMDDMDKTTAWLDAAQKRCDAATEGPWEAVASEIRGQVGYSVKSDAGTVVLFGGFGPRGGPQESDAVLAAAARTDLPATLAALRAVLDLTPETIASSLALSYGSHANPPRGGADYRAAETVVDYIRDAIATALGVTP